MRRLHRIARRRRPPRSRGRGHHRRPSAAQSPPGIEHSAAEPLVDVRTRRAAGRFGVSRRPSCISPRRYVADRCCGSALDAEVSVAGTVSLELLRHRGARVIGLHAAATAIRPAADARARAVDPLSPTACRRLRPSGTGRTRACTASTLALRIGERVRAAAATRTARPASRRSSPARVEAATVDDLRRRASDARLRVRRAMSCERGSPARRVERHERAQHLDRDAHGVLELGTRSCGSAPARRRAVPATITHSLPRSRSPRRARSAGDQAWTDAKACSSRSRTQRELATRRGLPALGLRVPGPQVGQRVERRCRRCTSRAPSTPRSAGGSRWRGPCRRRSRSAARSGRGRPRSTSAASRRCM